MLRHRDLAVVVVLTGKGLVSLVAVIENQRPAIPALRIGQASPQPSLDHLEAIVVSFALLVPVAKSLSLIAIFKWVRLWSAATCRSFSFGCEASLEPSFHLRTKNGVEPPRSKGCANLNHNRSQTTANRCNGFRFVELNFSSIANSIYVRQILAGWPLCANAGRRRLARLCVLRTGRQRQTGETQGQTQGKHNRTGERRGHTNFGHRHCRSDFPAFRGNEQSVNWLRLKRFNHRQP